MTIDFPLLANKSPTIFKILESALLPLSALYKLVNSPDCSEGLICILSSALEPDNDNADSI